jgi:hypothetical protein
MRNITSATVAEAAAPAGSDVCVNSCSLWYLRLEMLLPLTSEAAGAIV